MTAGKESELYARYRPGLESLARRLGAEDPESTASQVLFDCLRRRNDADLPDDAAFRSYVYRSLRNRVMTERRNRNYANVELDDAIVDTSPDHFDRLAGADGLMAMLDSLPPAQRDVVAHRFVGGYSAAETARRLGRSTGAVRRLQHDAIRRIRFLLAAGTLTALVLLVANVVRQDDQVIDSEPATVTPATDVPPTSQPSTTAPVTTANTARATTSVPARLPEPSPVTGAGGTAAFPSTTARNAAAGPTSTSASPTTTTPTSTPPPEPAPTTTAAPASDPAAPSTSSQPSPTAPPTTAAAANVASTTWLDRSVAPSPAPPETSLWLAYTGLCLDVADGSMDEGAPFIQWPCHGKANQQFEWRGSSLVVRHSGMCLDVSGDSRIVQAPCDGSRSQSLRLVDSQLVFAHSDLCLGMRYPYDQGARVIQQVCRGRDTYWAAVPAGER